MNKLCRGHMIADVVAIIGEIMNYDIKYLYFYLLSLLCDITFYIDIIGTLDVVFGEVDR